MPYGPAAKARIEALEHRLAESDAARERAYIVAWLRNVPVRGDPTMLNHVADAIERGDHDRLDRAVKASR